MPRWLWWTPFALLVGVFALLGLRLGWVAMTLTETVVIERQAQRYLADHGAGAKVTDCFAEPADEVLIWMTVECRPTDATARFRYHVHPLGGLLFWERYVPELKGPLT